MVARAHISHGGYIQYAIYSITVVARAHIGHGGGTSVEGCAEDGRRDDAPHVLDSRRSAGDRPLAHECGYM